MTAFAKLAEAVEKAVASCPVCSLAVVRVLFEARAAERNRQFKARASAVDRQLRKFARVPGLRRRRSSEEER